MSFYLWYEASNASVSSNQRVFRASELNAVRSLDDVCAQLQAQANEQAMQLDAVHQQARTAGYEQGLAEGRACAREEAAAGLLGLQEQLELARESLQSQVGQLALAVAQKLLGDFCDADRLAGLADTAAREMVSHGQPATPVKVVVHPKHLEAVRARLSTEDRSATSVRMIVQADPHCAEDSCRLESDLGAIDASLPVQLEQLAQAWGVK